MRARKRCVAVAGIVCIAGLALLFVTGVQGSVTGKREHVAEVPVTNVFPVLVIPVEERTFFERIQVQGNLKVAESVQVPPRGAGCVETHHSAKGYERYDGGGSSDRSGDQEIPLW